MAKIPFDIKYRPRVESGEYKVETRDGRPVRIACWDRQHKEFPLIVLTSRAGGEDWDVYTINGKFYYNQESSAHDLFIITPEPEVELSEFEKKLSDVVGYAISLSVTEPKKPTSEFVKEYASELLALARNELVKSGYAIIEGEHYLEEGRKNYERGKAEALKDLPKWKKCEDGNTDRLELEALCQEAGSPIEIAFRANGYRIFLSDLEQLPKEE